MAEVPLRNKELEELALKYYHQPDEDLASEIVEAITGLVYHFAGKYAKKGLWQDVTQAGFEGVLKALRKFEPSKGVLFSTYSSYYIIGEIHRELQKEANFKKPPGIEKIQSQILFTIDCLRQTLQREPSLEEISKATNIKEEGIIEAMLAGCVSLEELDISQIRGLRYESFKLPIEDQLIFKDALSKLSELQQKVIYLSFFQGLTQSKIAKEIGTNQRQVSRVINKALEQLAVYMIS